MRFDWRLVSLALLWPCPHVDGRISRMRRLLRAAQLTKRSTQCPYSHGSSSEQSFFASIGNATLEDGGEGSFVVGTGAAPSTASTATRQVRTFLDCA